MVGRKVLLWDFDGTLAHRPRGWSGVLVHLLEEAGLRIDRDDIRPYLTEGFPWHEPERSHHHLSRPDAWWESLYPVFMQAFVAVGLDRGRAEELAPEVRERYLDLAGWLRYEDTVPVLGELAGRGWRHIVVSNHVPELSSLVAGLGLNSYIEDVVSSARVGYEKPHPAIFREALRRAGVDAAWMIGDSYSADVCGARRLGIPGVLVRREHPEAPYRCEDLYELIPLVEGARD